MDTVPDTTIIDIHRTPRSPLSVDHLEGEAWSIPEGGAELRPLAVGDEIGIGDTLALAPGAVLVAGPVHLTGGRSGRAHALVNDRAFRPNPSRAQVPQLLLQLVELEDQAKELGGDPLSVHPGPDTAFERSASADFARTNLVLAAARELPESVARREGAVCLFVNEDTAFVAMASLSVAKLRAVIEALQRPVNPHMVEAATLDELLGRVYGAH